MTGFANEDAYCREQSSTMASRRRRVPGKGLRLAMAMTASVLAMSIAGVANAQDRSSTGSASDQSDSAKTASDTIIVTANKAGQTVLEAPESVSVIPAETIRAAGATNFSELSTLLPSVVFSSQQSPVQSNVGIRGVTTTGGSAALEPSVGIYVDGIFTDRTSIGVGDFNDIAAVEVLRGPQSTLFGNASPAGVINFVTKRPERTLGGDFETSYGNFNTVKASGTITGPLITDALYGRISGYYHRRDGYLKNLIGKDSNDLDALGARGRLLFDNDGPASLIATFEYSRTRQNCCLPVFDNVPDALIARFNTASTNYPFVGSGVPFPRDQYNSQTVAADGANTFDQDLYAVSLEGRFHLGAGYDLLSISAYRDIRQFSVADIDFTGLNLLNFPGVLRKERQVSQEIRFISPRQQPFTWLVGGYYFRKQVTEDSALIIDPQTAALLGGNAVAQNSPTFSSIKNENFAIFGEGNLTLFDKLKITGGVRYNYDDKGIYATAARLKADGTPLSPLQSIPPDKRGRTGGRLTYRGVAEYAFSDAFRTYFSYTRGYKAFGINDDANLIRNVPGANFFFDSEIVDNFEVGLKGSVPTLRATYSVVLFDTKYKNFQALSSFIDSTNTLRFYLQNAASLTSKGVEVDLTVRPFEHLMLSGSASYVDAKFDSFPNAQGPAGVRDLTGFPLTDAPKFSGSLVARYDTPINDKIKVYAQGDVFYRSSVFTELTYDPNLVQGAYTKFDARIGVGKIGKGWAIEAFGRNLSNTITFGRGGQPVFGSVTNLLAAARIATFPVGQSYIKFTGEPRTYGATLRFSF